MDRDRVRGPRWRATDGPESIFLVNSEQDSIATEWACFRNCYDWEADRISSCAPIFSVHLLRMAVDPRRRHPVNRRGTVAVKRCRQPP